MAVSSRSLSASGRFGGQRTFILDDENDFESDPIDRDRLPPEVGVQRGQATANRSTFHLVAVVAS